MSFRPERRVACFLAATILVVLAVIGLAFASRSSENLAFCTIAAPLGWLVAGIAALTIAAVSIVFTMSVCEKRISDGPELRSSSCAACGGDIIEGWRLCPHCGELLECDVRLPLHCRIAEGGET